MSVHGHVIHLLFVHPPFNKDYKFVLLNPIKNKNEDHDLSKMSKLIFLMQFHQYEI